MDINIMMRMHMKFFLLIVSICLFAVSVMGENLVYNSRFQDWKYWELPSDRTGIEAADGILKVSRAATITQQRLPLKGGESYLLEYEYKAAPGGKCRIYAEWTSNRDGQTIWLGSGAVDYRSGTGDWVKVSREFTYTLNSAPPYLVIGVAAGSTVEFRNITITHQPQAAQEAATGNLIRNPQFHGWKNWELPSDRTGIEAANGILKFSRAATITQQRVPLIGGESYLLEYEFKAETGKQCRVYLEWTRKEEGNTTWFGSGADYRNGTGDWVKVSREFDYTPNSDLPYLVIGVAAETGAEFRNFNLSARPRLILESAIGGQWNCPFGSEVIEGDVESGAGLMQITGVPVTAGKEYRLEFSVTGSGNSGTTSGYHPYRISAYFPEIAKTVEGPWDDTLPDTKQDKNFVFTVPEGVSKANFQWQVTTKGKLRIGGVKLAERVIPLSERYPVELDSPTYRNTIYASMPVEFIAGRVKTDDAVRSCAVELRQGAKTLQRSEGGTFKFPAGELAVGAYEIHALLGMADGQELSVVSEVMKAEPSDFEVVIGKDLNLYINGKVFYPVGFFQIPGHSDDTFADAAANGVNTILAEGINTDAQALPLLDLAGRHGIKVMLYTWNMRGTDAAAELAWQRHLNGLLTPKVLAHPALLGYFLDDEPSWGGRPLAWLQRSYELLKKFDPYRPIWINAAPRGSIEEHQAYSTACDIYGVDIYPVPVPDPHGGLSNKKLTVVGDYAERMAQSVNYRKPNWMVLQGFAWGALTGQASVYPTAAQNRFMIYDSLTRHGTAVSYWGLQYIDAPEFYYSVLFEGTRELHAMSGLLARGRKVDVFSCTNPAIRLYALELDGKYYLIALNTDDQPQAAAINGVRTAMQVIGENRTMAKQEQFTPYQVHIYAEAPLPPPVYQLPPAAPRALGKWIMENRLYNGKASWIWDRDTQNVAGGKAWLLREFNIDKEVEKAVFRISADDMATIYLNGKELGKAGSFTRMVKFDKLPLRPGKNILGVAAADAGTLPCGILADLKITFKDGSATAIVSDGQWRTASAAPANWDAPEAGLFNRPAAVVCPYGQGAWGNQTRMGN